MATITPEAFRQLLADLALPRPHPRDRLLHVAEPEFMDVLAGSMRAPRLECVRWHVLEAIGPVGGGIPEARVYNDPTNAEDIVFTATFTARYGSFVDHHWYQRPGEGEAPELAAWLNQAGPGFFEERYAELARRHDLGHRDRIEFGGGYRAGRTLQAATVAAESAVSMEDLQRAMEAMRARVVRTYQLPRGYFVPRPFDGPQREAFAADHPPLVRADDPKAMALRHAAIKRGEKLLREWLSAEQLAQYDRYKCFEVIGSATRRRYRIQQAGAFNVELLRADGSVEEEMCFLPEGGLVNGDVMLAQKVALETDENAALAVANRQYLGPVGRSPGMVALGIDYARGWLGGVTS